MFGIHLIRRANADKPWMLMLVAFGSTVTATRIFLEATGYPQIGGGELHFAHALWGGLLQFIALCVFLTFANRWTYTVSAILGGIGVGLFIDEVGKFMTKNNDYFFPFAAPIIYAALLLVTFLYLWQRRHNPRSPRAELYFVLDQLKSMVDGDLDTQRHTEIRNALERIVAAPQSAEQATFAQGLLALINEGTIVTTPPSILQRALNPIINVEKRFITRAIVQAFLILAFLLNSVGGVLLLFLLLALASDPTSLQQVESVLVNQAFAVSPAWIQWLVVHMLLTAIVGLLFLIAAILMILRRDRAAIEFARIALVVHLTLGNLLAFYFNQFAMISSTLIALVIFATVERYNARFVEEASPVRSTQTATVPSTRG
ncbi:MAG: hypothetical protein KF716_31560 [Anaerolineae bacterium]|nr:hypothetical protein [Anaerolineae bacterium]